MMKEVLKGSKHISPSANIGQNCSITAETLYVGDNVVIQDNVTIDGGVVVVEDGAFIGEDVTIRSDVFLVGVGVRISNGCVLQGLGRKASKIVLGDYSYLGDANKILMPAFVCGDYVTLHHHLLANGYKPCVIGHNTWIGQNCVLNSNDSLLIGNGVGIGAYSSIYTHAFFGELLEGCQVFNVAPVVIEDNVWIVGAYNVISPGVTLGEKSMILSSSVVSKDVHPLHCVGGVPAKDMTEKLSPFREVSLDEKFQMMRRFVNEFVEEVHGNEYTVLDDGYKVSPRQGEPFRIVICDDAAVREFGDEDIVLVYTKNSHARMSGKLVTVFDVSTKQYTKRRTEPEYRVIKFMNSYRARFIPDTQPRVVLGG